MGWVSPYEDFVAYLDFVSIDYHLRDFQDICDARGF